jgi:hydroxylamine reductase
MQAKIQEVTKMAKIEITKDMLVGDIVNNIEGAAGALMESGMHCLGCPASQSESLENACMVHGLNVDEVLAKVNAAVQ